jgi:biopolymer transport protein ExbD
MVRIRKQKDPKKAYIDMIPLIDCVFQLLIFFMYSFISMTYFTGLPLDIPKAKAVEEFKKNIVQIDMKKNNQIFFEGKRINYIDLANNLNSKNKSYKVFLRAEKDVVYNDLVKVMDCVRKEGFGKVVLGTARDEK